MALGADFHLNLRLDRADGENIAAITSYFGIRIPFRMNIRFHKSNFSILTAHSKMKLPMKERLRGFTIKTAPEANFLQLVTPEWEKIARRVIDIFFRVTLSAFEVEGKENIPKDFWRTPHIIAHNHLGWAEVPALLKVFPRWIYWMTKAENFENGLLAPILRRCAFFPVRRGEVDRRALRTAERLLDHAEIVGMAPEGTRGRGENLAGLKEAKNGTIRLAIKAQAPIIPVAVWGPEKILPLVEEEGFNFPELRKLWREKPKIWVRIAKPFTQHLEKDFEGKIRSRELTPFTTNLMLKIRDMLPPNYHGFYAHVERLPLL